MPNSVTPMDCSMPGFPVLHHLPAFAQTHVHRVGDTIQPSHPPSAVLFSCPQSVPASGSFPMSWLFTSGSQSTGASALDTISLFYSFLNLILDLSSPMNYMIILSNSKKLKKTLVFILMELHEINFKRIDFIIRFLIQKHENLPAIQIFLLI